MANKADEKGTWKKGDLKVDRIVYKGKVVKSVEELRRIKEEEKKQKK